MMSHEVLPLDRWRAATDGLVGEAASTDTVHFTTLVDASGLEAVRRFSGREVKPTYTALVVEAISKALRKHPEMNRLILPHWPFRFRPVQLHEVHAVVAVERVRAGEDTVYAGVIRNSDQKSALELTKELRGLAQVSEAADPRLRLFMRLVRWAPGLVTRRILGLPRWAPAWWLTHRGGSFALTTIGKYGVDSVSVKWPWPLTFTFGEVKPRPVVVEDAVAARQSFYLTMGWRRDLCNGAPAARFFQCIVDLLEKSLPDTAPARSGQADPDLAAIGAEEGRGTW